MEPADPTPLAEAHADADALFKSLYSGGAAWSAARTAVDRKLTALYAGFRADPPARDAFERLRWHPSLAHRLTRPEPVLAARGPSPGNTLHDALGLLALRHESWVREPEAWPGDGAESRAALGGLARHLLADWPVPTFADEAWLLGYTTHGRLWRDVFAAVGAGHSLKRLVFPAPMTERARHHFLQAPDFLSVTGALRWGQTLGMGGDPRLAYTLVETKLAEPQDDEGFWETVLRFLVDRPDFPRAQVGPLVDFLASRRDAEPEFSMKGRTVDALLRRMAEWHDELAKAARGPKRSWEPMGLPPFEMTEKDPAGSATLTWTLVELLDTHALMVEGGEMRHCVRTYAGDCVQGTKAIFSLRLRASDSKTTRRVLTVEVLREKRSVVQVRGKANCLPKDQPPHSRVRRGGEIVRQWARERGLGLAATF